MPTACLPLRRLLPWLLLCTLAAPGPGALAQVLRCTDPVTGKVSYTDGRCDSGSQALEIEPRKSAEQLQAERTQAAEAAKKKAEDEKIAKAKADNCTRARQAKATFESGRLITHSNAKGERVFLDDATRAAESKRIDGIIATDCAR